MKYNGFTNRETALVFSYLTNNRNYYHLRDFDDSDILDLDIEQIIHQFDLGDIDIDFSKVNVDEIIEILLERDDEDIFY